MKKYNNVFEIFFASNFTTKEKWHKLILSISKYLGILQKWELIVHIDMNEIRYFILSHKELPPTIGDMSEFLFKKSDMDLSLKTTFGFYYQPDANVSVIDIFDTNEIKYSRYLKQIIFCFSLLKNDHYLTKTNFIFEKNKQLIFQKSFTKAADTILSINYEGSRFFYKKKPKYLDIQKTLHLLKSESTNSILKIDTFPYLPDGYYLNQNEYNFDRHSLIIGGSGTGKSKLMSLFINNISNNADYRMKYKLVVIDPHASLEGDIGGLTNSAVLDYTSIETSANLFTNNSEDIAATAEMLLTLFRSLMVNQYNARMERMLRYTAYVLLTKKEFSFINMRKLLLETEFRNSLIKELTPNLPNPVIDFFLTDFNELKTKNYNEAIAPIIAFIDEVILLPAFQMNEQLNSIEDTIRQNFLTILSLNRTKLGENATKTIVGLALGQIMDIIQSAKINEHIILLIDEVPVIENPMMARFLSEARKYNLSLVLASQYFNQISEELRNSIFANVANYYIFRVAKLDAILLEENLSIKLSVDNTVENRVNLLANLSDRQCIVRVNANGVVLPAIKAETLDYISKPKKRVDIKLVQKTVNINPINEVVEKTFSIESKTTLRDLMLEQSTSRRKVRND